MGQVAAVGQLHTHHGVAGLEQGQLHGHVGLGAGVGLDVGVGAVEELLGPLNGDVLHHVHILAAAIVAVAGIALGVFVGQGVAGRQLNGPAGKVLGGDQLNVALLTIHLRLDGAGHLHIHLIDDVYSVHVSFLLFGMSIYVLRLSVKKTRNQKAVYHNMP